MENHSKTKFWLLSGLSLVFAAIGLWITIGKGIDYGVILSILAMIIIMFAKDYGKNINIVYVKIMVEATVAMSVINFAIVLFKLRVL